jgi:hypothetical protein
MIVDVRRLQCAIEGRYLALQPAVERAAAELCGTDPDLAALYLTEYSVLHAEDLVRRWRALGEQMLTTYNDGYVQDADGQPQEKGYPEAWLREVIERHPDKLKLPTDAAPSAEPKDY